MQRAHRRHQANRNLLQPRIAQRVAHLLDCAADFHPGAHEAGTHSIPTPNCFRVDTTKPLLARMRTLSSCDPPSSSNATTLPYGQSDAGSFASACVTYSGFRMWISWLGRST